MGTLAIAVLEIDAFRLLGDPEVLDVGAVKSFLSGLAGTNGDTQVEIKELKWLHHEEPGWEDRVNRAVPGTGFRRKLHPDSLLDQELEVSGAIIMTVHESPYKFNLRSTHERGNEYVGNGREHSLVISYEPRWGRVCPIAQFTDGASKLLSLSEWIINRGLVPKKTIENRIETITT